MLASGSDVDFPTSADFMVTKGQKGTITDRIPSSCRTPTGGAAGSDGKNAHPAITETVAREPDTKAHALRNATRHNHSLCNRHCRAQPGFHTCFCTGRSRPDVQLSKVDTEGPPLLHMNEFMCNTVGLHVFRAGRGHVGRSKCRATSRVRVPPTALASPQSPSNCAGSSGAC